MFRFFVSQLCLSGFYASGWELMLAELTIATFFQMTVYIMTSRNIIVIVLIFRNWVSRKDFVITMRGLLNRFLVTRDGLFDFRLFLSHWGSFRVASLKFEHRFHILLIALGFLQLEFRQLSFKRSDCFLKLYCFHSPQTRFSFKAFVDFLLSYGSVDTFWLSDFHLNLILVF